MTRKDYVSIAEILKASNENWEGFAPEGCEAVVGLARSLAFRFQIDNPRFDRDRFLEACGVK